MKYFNRKRFKLYKLFILDEKRGIVEGLLTCIITKKSYVFYSVYSICMTLFF